MGTMQPYYMGQKSRSLHALGGRRYLADLQRWLNENVAPEGVTYDHRAVKAMLQGMGVSVFPRGAGKHRWFYARQLREQSPDLAEKLAGFLDTLPAVAAA